MSYSPPLDLSDKLTDLSEEVERLIDQAQSVLEEADQNLLKDMKQESLIHSIYSTLKIEHNSLSLDQISQIIHGKHAACEQREMQEVKNAVRVYEWMETFNPFDSDDLLKAHRILMEDLI